MLHTKYQGSRHYGFRQEELFHVSSYISLCKASDPKGGHFWPHGHNLKKLGRGLQGDATYQNIKALGLMVTDKGIFSCFSLYKPMESM